VLGGIIYRWLLLFQEFDFEVVVKHGRLNAGPDHLSRITNGEEPSSLEDNFPNAQLFLVHIVDEKNSCLGKHVTYLGGFLAHGFCRWFSISS
jgi:hypothetical protein